MCFTKVCAGLFLFPNFFKSREPTLLEVVKSFAVGELHVYGHQSTCQVNYHPKRVNGAGNSAFEQCEQLWSQLKPLVRTTRYVLYLSMNINNYRCRMVEESSPFL